MPVSQDDSENNVALAMQRVFYDLQVSFLAFCFSLLYYILIYVLNGVVV